MAANSRSRRRQASNYWPGFVDALSTLVMVVIFVLLVFLVAQYYLSSALSSREAALEKLNVQVNELAQLLSLEQSKTAELSGALAGMTAELDATRQAKDELSAQIAALIADKGELEGRLAAATADLEAAKQTVTAGAAQIEAQLAELALLTTLRDQLTEEVAQLSAALTAAQDKAAALESAQATRADEIARLKQALAAAEAARADLERQVATLAVEQTEGAAALAAQTALTVDARAQVEALNAQLTLLRQQLARLAVALDASEARAAEQDVQIANLGERLNQALADKVQELARYRSEFFGRLREILGERQDLRVVGDRFVFQSEVLFEPGQATLGPRGQTQLAELAKTLRELTAEIPQDLDWVLQVDGHTDRVPIANAPFASNWELSAARAISVVAFLIDQGLPPERLAAAGYGEFQPLETGDSEEAYRANRRIEIKLTNR